MVENKPEIVVGITLCTKTIPIATYMLYMLVVFSLVQSFYFLLSQKLQFVQQNLSSQDECNFGGLSRGIIIHSLQV